MKTAELIKLTDAFERFEDTWCRYPKKRGRFIRQSLIRIATRRQAYRGEEIAGPAHTRNCKAVTIPISKIVSDQRCLYYHNLRWHLRHRAKRRPSAVRLPDGFYLLWDGNHRTTRAIMRGERKIKVDLIWRIVLTSKG